ncbi:MAG: hypothetical protein KatS3mg114_0292 [Planctomycetaceae bacterium]|nr:MAG: hypothetical protein KatS3mg114_0292 [Planctomycetaceae bacterium]
MLDISIRIVAGGELLLLLYTLYRLPQLYRILVGTTLTIMVPWLGLGTLLGMVSTGLVWLRGQTNPMWDYLWLVTCLVPLIAVLGARSPQHRAWPFFVLMPLWVILWGPVLLPSVQGAAFHLEGPWLLMLLVVFVLGGGNVLGVPGGGTTLLHVMAAVTWSLSWAEVLPEHLRWDWLWHVLHTLGWGGRIHTWHVLLTQPITGNRWTRLQQLWLHFTALYGLVWSQRIRDKLMTMARRRECVAVLEVGGFHTPCEPSETEQRFWEDHLHGLLRHFVQETWWQRYLPAAEPTATEPSAAATEPIPRGWVAPDVVSSHDRLQQTRHE